ERGELRWTGAAGGAKALRSAGSSRRIFGGERALVLDRVPDLLDCFAHLSARLADVFLDGSGGTLSGPFGFEIRIVCGLTHPFLDVALRLFDFPLQLILVHARLLGSRVPQASCQRPLTVIVEPEAWKSRRVRRSCGVGESRRPEASAALRPAWAWPRPAERLS